MRCLEGAEDVLTGAGARIYETGSAELFKGRTIEIRSLALRVRAERTAAVGAFLPFATEPAEVFEHSRDKFGPTPRPVEILVAKDQGAIRGTGTLLGDPERASVAEVEKTGWRRSEAAAVRGSCCLFRIQSISE